MWKHRDNQNQLYEKKVPPCLIEATLVEYLMGGPGHIYMLPGTHSVIKIFGAFVFSLFERLDPLSAFVFLIGLELLI